jgi:hypothetical protein
MKRNDEHHKYGSLIAKLMREKITDKEAQELDEWALASDRNMNLFESLINEYKQEWAKEWFRKAGVNTRGIKWERVEGWYQRDRNLWDFYIVMVVMFMVLAGVYFLLEL